MNSSFLLSFFIVQQYEKIQVEVEILRSLRHKNIVSYLGTSMQHCTIYIFMEYISGGSLQSILKRSALMIIIYVDLDSQHFIIKFPSAWLIS